MKEGFTANAALGTNGIPNDVLSTDGEYANQQIIMHEGIYDGTNGILRVDGTTKATNAIALANTLADGHIGADSDGNTDFWDGNI